MRALIVDNQWVYFDNITTHEDDILWAEFSVSRPNAYVDPTQLGMWDGIFRKYNRAKKRVALPLLQMVQDICHKHGLPLDIEDKRQAHGLKILDKSEIGPDFLPGITLEDYQIKGIQLACEVDHGIMGLMTGSGKTEILAGICKAIDCNTIILADQRIIIDQIKKRLELRTIADDVGIFYAGKRPNGQAIIVGSIQSLASPPKPPKAPIRKPDETQKAWEKRLLKFQAASLGYKTRVKNSKILREYVKRADMLLCDECDKCTSDIWKNVFRFLFKGRKRYGFSGTPTDLDKPVEALVMQEHLGPILLTETRKNLEEKGRIIPTEYFTFGFGLQGDIKDASMFDLAYDEWMVHNPVYHKLIVSLCKKYANQATICLVEREALGLALLEALTAEGVSARFIYGKTPTKARDAALRGFERREFSVLLGGKIINRGLDLSGGCDNLIVATGGKLQSEFLQKVGRALRMNASGKSRVFDFFFRCNRHLYKHSKNRLIVMNNAGYKTTIVMPGGTICGADLIARNFRFPPKLLLRPEKLLF